MNLHLPVSLVGMYLSAFRVVSLGLGYFSNSSPAMNVVELGSLGFWISGSRVREANLHTFWSSSGLLRLRSIWSRNLRFTELTAFWKQNSHVALDLRYWDCIHSWHGLSLALIKKKKNQFSVICSSLSYKMYRKIDFRPHCHRWSFCSGSRFFFSVFVDFTCCEFLFFSWWNDVSLQDAIPQLIYRCSCLLSLVKLKLLQLEQKPLTTFLVAVNKIVNSRAMWNFSTGHLEVLIQSIVCSLRWRNWVTKD